MSLSAPDEKKKVDSVDEKWLDFALEMTLEFYKDPDTVSSYGFRYLCYAARNFSSLVVIG